MQIGTAIALQRLEKGLTQPELARLSGIAQANLSNIEKGKRDLNLVTLKRISFALGTTAWSLLRSAEEESQRLPLTRKDLEGLAKAVLGDEAQRPHAMNMELVKALRGLFSLEHRRSDKALERDRLEAGRYLSQKDIELIRSRVEDEVTRRS